jgi:hypothetical protein
MQTTDRRFTALPRAVPAATRADAADMEAHDV